MSAFGGSQLADMPGDAEVSRHSLRHGDVLVFATDGVWDNLFNQDILRIVSAAMEGSGAWVHSDAGGIRVRPDLSAYTSTPSSGDGDGKAVSLQSLIATSITGAAKAASVNTKLDGPFAKEVKKYYPMETWRGGKVDDICVVAVVVSETTPDDAPVKAKL
jgi:protein phosphatase PTC7